jgi:hypothetical protein
VAAAACAGAGTAVAGFEARSSTGVAANRQSLKVRFTANLPKKEIPCGDIESQVAEKVAGIVWKVFLTQKFQVKEKGLYSFC